MSKRIIILLVVALVPTLAFGAITGKIKGRVVDQETGEPLPGAAVMIVNTTMGAAADANGEYLMLHVPVGVYSVRAQFIGYKTVTIENIKVITDLTNTIDFELPIEAIAGETITIVAERPLVNPNATNAVRVQGYEDFKNVPVRNPTQVIALQPGVVVQNGNLYVRGGREDEVGYYLEGATTRDVMTGDNLVTVIPEALQEYQLQAGGYTAAYGGANAGIIRQTFRSGTPDYKFSLQAETDNFADPGDSFLDTYSYGYSDYTLTASGPVPGTNGKLKFFVAGQNTFERVRDTQLRYYEGFEFNHAETYVDDHNFPLVSTTYGDTIKQGLSMLDNYIPKANRNRYIGSGTLVWDNNPYMVRFAANLSYHTTESVGTKSNLVNILNLDRIGQNQLSTGLYSLKFTHILNPKTIYEINLNYFDRRSAGWDPYFGHNYFAYYDSLANSNIGVDFIDW